VQTHLVKSGSSLAALPEGQTSESGHQWIHESSPPFDLRSRGHTPRFGGHPGDPTTSQCPTDSSPLSEPGCSGSDGTGE